MGYYVIKKATSGQFYFNLHADNHQVILTGEMYESKQGCANGIASCQENTPNDGNYDRLTAKNGQHYFNLKAQNHQIIGTSEMYTTTAARDNGIESCKRNGPTNDVRDQS